MIWIIQVDCIFKKEYILYKKGIVNFLIKLMGPPFVYTDDVETLSSRRKKLTLTFAKKEYKHPQVPDMVQKQNWECTQY